MNGINITYADSHYTSVIYKPLACIVGDKMDQNVVSR